MNFDLKKLEEERKKNFKERLDFIKKWVEYIKTHSDEEWGEQQGLLINSQFEN